MSEDLFFVNGKGSGIIVPNILRHPGSYVTIDPNPENANITAHARARRGFKVVALDPYEKAQRPAAQHREGSTSFRNSILDRGRFPMIYEPFRKGRSRSRSAPPTANGGPTSRHAALGRVGLA